MPSSLSGRDWQNVAQVIAEREVAPPSAIVPQLSRQLDAIVLKGLEKDPAKRFESALDMALAIERCMHIATTHEIGEWVTRTATGVLAERAQKIAEIESRSSEEPAAPVPMPAPARATPIRIGIVGARDAARQRGRHRNRARSQRGTERQQLGDASHPDFDDS